MAPAGPILFFDGHCPLCHWAVRFVARKDRSRSIRFAPLEGSTAARILGPAAAQLETVVLVLDPEGEARRVERSSAVATLLGVLPRPWSWLGRLLGAMPRFVGDAAYRLVAANRRRLGRYESCPLPPPELRGWFLG